MKKKLVITLVAGVAILAGVFVATKYKPSLNKLNVASNEQSQVDTKKPIHFTLDDSYKEFFTLNNYVLKATPKLLSYIYENPSSPGLVLLNGKEFHFNRLGDATVGFLDNNGLKYFDKKGVLLTGFQNINGKFYKFNESKDLQISTLKLGDSGIRLGIPNIDNGVAVKQTLTYGNIILNFNKNNGVLDSIVNTENKDIGSGQNLKSFISENPTLGKYINLNSEGFVTSISSKLAKALHSNPLSNGWIQLGSYNYHFDEDGTLTKGFYTDTKGITTLSNKYGEMDTGFQRTNGRFYYLAPKKGIDNFTLNIDGETLDLSVWKYGSGNLTKNTTLKFDKIEFEMGDCGKLKNIIELNSK